VVSTSGYDNPMKQKLLVSALFLALSVPSVVNAQALSKKDSSYISDFSQNTPDWLSEEIVEKPNTFIRAANKVCNMRYGGLSDSQLIAKQLEHIQPNAPDFLLKGMMIYFYQLDTMAYKHYCPQYTR